ncbi:MAG: PKD domain-containing protein [Bacteroidota bacterium]
MPVFIQAQIDSAVVYRAEDSTRIKVTRLDLNSEKSDFSPVFLNNTLLFSSARENNIGVKYSGYEDESEITDLFVGSKRDSVSFKNIKPLAGSINSKYSEGPFTFSKDGNVIYYTGNAGITKKQKGSANLLKIYHSEKVNGAWTKPVIAEFCEPEYSYCHPSLSNDGKTLFFCSNKPGGFGGMDIYMIKYENNSWTKSMNLGSKINTVANEVFPFIACNNKLYFSANKPFGYGGLDIYTFDMNDPIDNEVMILEYPVNSASDDFGIWTDSSGTSGYFSTNRVPKHGDDIYYFGINIPDFSNAQTPVFKNKFCYTFFEETALETNDTTSLAYEWNFGDGTRSKQLTSRHCFAKPGNYVVSLNSVEKSTGEIFANQVTYTLTIDEPPKLFVSCADTLLAGREVILSSEKCALKDYQLDRTYWSFGDGKYNSGRHVKHVYNKPGKYVIQLGVYAKNNTTNQIEQFKIEKHIIVKDNF